MHRDALACQRKRVEIQLKYRRGETIPAGYYLRNDTWEIVCVPEDGALREGEDLTYYRVPLPVVLLLGPLAGLVWRFESRGEPGGG